MFFVLLHVILLTSLGTTLMFTGSNEIQSKQRSRRGLTVKPSTERSTGSEHLSSKGTDDYPYQENALAAQSHFSFDSDSGMVTEAVPELNSQLSAKRPNDPKLSIATTSGVYFGSRLSVGYDFAVDIWKGIPYAKPPIGPLRFRAPIVYESTPKASKGKALPALQFGPACPQPGNPYFKFPQSEDCLTLNIFRPSDLPKGSAPLPVLVWIHGGSLTYGGSAPYDGTLIVKTSIEISKPIIFVSINYRLNSFGFLNTQDLPLEDLQVGLKDQVAALKWLNLNLMEFGGDHNKVTIWGQSAGAFSVSLLMTYLPASNPLFRAAIMDSGSPTSHSVPRVEYYDEPGAPYNLLLKYTGCNAGHPPKKTKSNPSPTPGGARLECLRSLSYQELLNATMRVCSTPPYSRQLTVWGPSYKKHSMIDRRPSQRLQAGAFLHIPVLMGTNKDEGTLFVAQTSKANPLPYNEPEKNFNSFVSDSSLLDTSQMTPKLYKSLNRLYPNDPNFGSPFDTGPQTFGMPKLFKKFSAWFGDAHYQAPKRFWADKTSQHQPTFVYYFDGPPSTADPGFSGVPHSAETRLLFSFGVTPAMSQAEKISTAKLARKMKVDYINFVNDLQPGKNWPAYTRSDKLVMRYNKQKSQGEITKDDWRWEQSDYLNSQAVLEAFIL